MGNTIARTDHADTQDNNYADLDPARGTRVSALYQAIDKDGVGDHGRISLTTAQQQPNGVNPSTNGSHSDSTFTRNHLIIGAVVQCFVVIVLATVGSFVAYNMAISKDPLSGTKSGGLKQGNVFFRATYLSEETLRPIETLVFKTVLTNFGSGYDPQTGEFTAPTTGVYILSAQFCAYSGHYFNFGFYVDDLRVQVVSLYGVGLSKAVYTCDTHTVMYHLNEGSKVDMRCTKADYNVPKLHSIVDAILDVKPKSHRLMSIFSGVLLTS